MEEKIRVKFLSKNRVPHDHFLDLPTRHDHLEFVFDLETTNYDWLVVYDDLPAKSKERLSLNYETLACPQEQTILITYEPSSVKFYGQDYMNQYGYVLTSHEKSELKHPGRRDVPPVGVWYYGSVADTDPGVSLDEKTQLISTFYSAKTMGHTLHQTRAQFIDQIKQHVPQLVYYGRGYKFVEKKLEGINPYRYHIALENHIGQHHWTEKLSDSFLGLSLPFYCGCPNLEDYFPKESFIPIDMRDPVEAGKVINRAIENNEFEKRLPALQEARRLVIEEYNLANYIGDCIAQAPSTKLQAVSAKPNKILSRHLIMHKNIPAFIRYGISKTLRRRRNAKKWRAYCQTNS